MAGHWDMNEMLKRDVDPDEPYSMKYRNLGHAYIVNNIAEEIPGSMVDVKALKEAYKMVGFEVKTGCNDQEVDAIKDEIVDEKTHEDSNCVMLTIITHGNEAGQLGGFWDVEETVRKLNRVDKLVGKPKLLLIQACRGGEVTAGRPAAKTLGTTEPDMIADKADFYIAYATVPGYAAISADSSGSYYMQSFAKNLKKYFMTHSIDRILTCVRHDMETTVERGIVSKGITKREIRQCPEDRCSLRRVLMFSEFHKKPKTLHNEEVEVLKKEMERQKADSEKKQQEMMDQMNKMMEMMQTMQAGGQKSVAGEKPGDEPGAQKQSTAQAADHAQKSEGKTQDVERDLTDVHILKVSQLIEDEPSYTALATYLGVGNKKKNISNNPREITNAAYNMLNEWKRSIATAREQWRVLKKALEEAKLQDCVNILMT